VLRNCISGDEETFSYVRKRADLSQEYRGKTVPGIIMDVTHRMIKTPAVVVDALLGQGEALDCYNNELQGAAVVKAKLENNELQQAIDVITGISDPAEKANLYKKVFTDCCDVPQSGCNCQSKTSN